ncbi:MAG: CRISPR-associated endonuclease Cas2 [Armatimonadetes bacterium]|nr:CRISPR-associated endonuclease Cas2 [Armatimonadota bacterium]
MREDYLVSYDVNTEDKEGRRRLVRVAKACKNFGQRVQYSVFECSVNEMEYEKLRSKLVSIIDLDRDSLRIYRLKGLRSDYIESYGLDRYVDFDEDALIV